MAKESDDGMWAYPAHTKAKHEILDSYLGGWYPKLSQFGRILFFDGFAGRGVYSDGSEGSPLIALRNVLAHSAIDRSCSFEFLFVERDAKNAKQLSEVISMLRTDIGGFPANVKVEIKQGSFEDYANVLAEQNRLRAPTFAFIDPFGYSGIPMDAIVHLTRHPTTEVFVNLMVDHLGRFVERDGQSATVSALYGLPAEQVMSEFGKGIDTRHVHLRDLNIQQLRSRAGFPYITSFGMKTDTGHVGYYLLHGTRHIEGIRLMKAAMWKVDPINGGMFSDQHSHHDQLFQMGADLHPLKKSLLDEHGGENDVCLEDLRNETLIGSSAFRDTHVPQAIKELEVAGLARVEKRGRRQAQWYVSFV